MTSKRTGRIRWGSKRRVSLAPAPVKCGGWVLRCVEAGQHNPPCRCDDVLGHSGRCSYPSGRKW